MATERSVDLGGEDAAGLGADESAVLLGDVAGSATPGDGVVVLSVDLDVVLLI